LSESLPSIIEKFYQHERDNADRVFLRQPVGDNWIEMTYSEAGREARKVATELSNMGLLPGDHVGILSKNCRHWVITDLAIMMAGLVSVSYYPSLPKDQLAEVIDLSDIKALFIGRLEKWGDRGETIDESIKVIRFPHYQGDAKVDIGEEWSQLIANSEPLKGNPTPDLNSVWTIKYTSGTTGTPKGVVHLHRTPALLISNEIKTNWIGVFKLSHPKYFSYLPLNHISERMGVEVPAIYGCGSISFAENLESFFNNLKDVQPVFFFAVPRIWTKFYQGVTAKIPESKLNLLLKIPVVSSLVKRKLLNSIGLGNVKVAATGAAITPAFIKDFYGRLGIHLIEAYGMTETCGSITNAPDPKAPQDSVGQAVPGAKLRVDKETGEILMSTPYMMAGYYNNQQKTAEVLEDGWLQSGDKGVIDDQGYVRITGRVKDAFKTAKGSYVTPNPMEEFIAGNKYVEQVCVAGLGIPQPIAIINLGEAATGQTQEIIAASLLKTIGELNPTRAKFEHISTVVVQREAWSDQNGFLTPTLKVKRSKLDETFGEKYLDWHESSDPVIWA